jgi:hippurate hydrolase
VYNDPALTRRLVQVFSQAFGGDRVVMLKPEMGGEDFGFFGMVEPRIPICIFRLGAVDPGLIPQGRSSHRTPPSLHSSTFAPLPTPTITTGVEAMTLAVLDCLRGAYPATRELQAGRSGRPKDSPKTTGE